MSKEKVLSQLKKIAERDAFFYCKAVAGHKDLTKKNQEMAYHLDRSDIKLKGIVAPRGTMKTSVAKGVAMKKASLNPNIRILYAKKTTPGARKALRSIMASFQGNGGPLMTPFFGDLVPENTRADGVKWSEEGFNLNRTGALDECTFEASGMKTGKIGSHYDIAVVDDPIAPDKDELTERDVALRPEDLSRAKGWLQALDGLLDRQGMREVWYIGTKWAPNDCIAFLKEVWPEMVWHESTADDFPTIYPPEVIEDLRNRLSPFFFNCQLYNTADNPESKIFNIRNLQEYRRAPARNSMKVSVVIDPATSSKGGSKTAILAAGTTEDGRVFVLEYVYDNLSVIPTTNKTLELCEKYDPDVVAFENVAYQEALGDMLHKEMRDRGTKRWKIYPIKRKGRSKSGRIESLRYYVESGDIFVREGMLELKNEFDGFSGHAGDKADLLDTLTDHVTLTLSDRTPIQRGTVERDEEVEVKSGPRKVENLRVGIYQDSDGDFGLCAVIYGNKRHYVAKVVSGRLTLRELLDELADITSLIPTDNVACMAPKDLAESLKNVLPFRVKGIRSTKGDEFKVAMLGNKIDRKEIALQDSSFYRQLSSNNAAAYALEIAMRKSGGGNVRAKILDGAS